MFFKVHSANVIGTYSPSFFKNDTYFHFEHSLPFYEFDTYFNFYFEHSLPFYELYIFSDIIINEFSLFNSNVKLGLSKYFIKDKEYNFCKMNFKGELIIHSYTLKDNFKNIFDYLDFKIQFDVYNCIYNNLNVSISYSIKESVQFYIYLFAKKKGIKLYSNLNLKTIYKKIEKWNAPEFDKSFLNTYFPEAILLNYNKKDLDKVISDMFRYSSKEKNERLNKFVYKSREYGFLEKFQILGITKESLKNQKIDKDSLKEIIAKAYRAQSLKWHPDKNSNKLNEATEKAKEINNANEIFNKIFENEASIIDEFIKLLQNNN